MQAVIVSNVASSEIRPALEVVRRPVAARSLNEEEMRSSGVTLRNSIHFTSGGPWIDKWLLQQVFRAIGPAPVSVALKDGQPMSPSGVSPIASIIIRDRRMLAQLMLDPEMAFGEGYADGRIQVEGDLVAALEAIYESWPSGRAEDGWYERLTSKCLDWLQDNTLRGSRKNIHRHYDLGNDFYKLWLDSEMVYTCAYFPSPSLTLEAAQEAKMDYICRKLHLQAGETVVEAGCGWGALALYMAQHYGVNVKAFNISREQIAYARRTAQERDLSGQVEFVEDDFRNISGKFDVFVSVGMLEHVGVRHFADFGEVVHRSVGDAGRGLLHFIGRSYQGDFSRWIRRRIFPGAYAPTLAEVMNALQPRRYSVWDVENLRPHYARTLEHWLERFERSSQSVSERYDLWFQRAWRLYLAGSIAAFRTGTLQLFQITFAGAKSQPLSWTRASLYADAKCAGQAAKWIPATS
jgi:cyclopropane-fatty-acyl-phospholipid synthase